MRLQELYTLETRENEKENFLRNMFGNNILRNVIAGLLITLLIAILLLTNIDTLIINNGKKFNLNQFIWLYLLIVLLFFSWIVTKIIYENSCIGFRSRESLKKEIEKTRLINEMLKKANKELKELSLTDELTNIPNSRSFSNYLDSVCKNNLKRKPIISIIMIDIDYFKKYNDWLGHNEANKVLIAVAQQINSACRNSNDHAARYGGDEFIFASLNTNENQINELAELIRNKVKELKILNKNFNNLEFTSLSLGTSTVRAATKEDIYRCIELADKALYAAKENGRDCVKSVSDILSKQTTEYMMFKAN
jgi:diguanylate cyclase (GGDEF)-like protein